jgi:hypothetical protein
MSRLGQGVGNDIRRVLEKQQMREMTPDQLRQYGEEQSVRRRNVINSLDKTKNPDDALDYYIENSPRVSKEELKELDTFFKQHPQNIQKKYKSIYMDRDPRAWLTGKESPAYYIRKVPFSGTNPLESMLSNLVYVSPEYRRAGIIAHEHTHAGRQLLSRAGLRGVSLPSFPQTIKSFFTPEYDPKNIREAFPHEYATSRVGLDRLREFYKNKGTYSPELMMQPISTQAAAYDTYQMENANTGGGEVFLPTFKKELSKATGANLLLNNLTRDTRIPPIKGEHYLAGLDANSRRHPPLDINEVSNTERRLYKDLGYTSNDFLSGDAKRKAYNAAPAFRDTASVIEDLKPLVNVPKNISSTYSHLISNPTDYGLPKPKLAPTSWAVQKALYEVNQELRKPDNRTIDVKNIPNINWNNLPKIDWTNAPPSKVDWNAPLTQAPIR